MTVLKINIERVDMRMTCWKTLVWFAQHPYETRKELCRAKTKKEVIQEARRVFPDNDIVLVKKDWLDW